MKKITQTGVGTATPLTAVRDTNGTGILPIQADGDGATSFRVVGRVSLEAPWMEVRAASTDDFLETISWIPYVGLEVTAGSGTVVLYVGEK